MKFIRKFIIRLIVKEIEINGITIGNKRIFNKDGAITIVEVSDGNG